MELHSEGSPRQIDAQTRLGLPSSTVITTAATGKQARSSLEASSAWTRMAAALLVACSPGMARAVAVKARVRRCSHYSLVAADLEKRTAMASGKSSYGLPGEDKEQVREGTRGNGRIRREGEAASGPEQ